MKKKRLKLVKDLAKTGVGCALFGFGLNFFLMPAELNAGGLSGLAMVLQYLLQFGTVGTLTLIMNIPLFIIGGLKIGRRFFFGSLVGMVLTSLFIDLFAWIPTIPLEPLLGALYGGVVCGFGLGCVFSAGLSTGGSDIIVRLVKMKHPHVQIGVINICFDLCVAALTGLVFRNLKAALYSGVAIFVTGKVIDMVVYRFDYSKVALIVTKDYQAVADAVMEKLDRGATLLHGEGAYSHQETKVVLVAVKKQQIAELKELVAEIDPDAFVILQEAHQVLGDGFSRYSKDAL